MRKEASLIESDNILLHVSSEKEIEDIVKKHEVRLMAEVNATKIDNSLQKQMIEHKIDGRIVKVALKKA